MSTTKQVARIERSEIRATYSVFFPLGFNFAPPIFD
jgi:hypothetical protein